METKISSFSCEDQLNLHIVENLDQTQLPASLQQMLSLAQTPEEQDILLLSTLTAASACVPNLYFRYGPTGKKYFANLQCFILAAAASGKGIANQALEMIRVIDKQYPMLIAGDSTLPAWYKALEARGGCGYMHESEGSVITDIWRTAAANYNTALRKAAEHEPISRNRCNSASEIPCPKLSMLLTGTFNQYRALVPSVENGYFSRLLTLVIRGSHPFCKSYVCSAGSQSAVPRVVGRQLLKVYEHLAFGPEREWSLTDSQKDRLGTHLETEYETLIALLGDNFHSAVIRMAVQIERIAMILSAMRIQNTDRVSDRLQTKLLCSDADYEAAEVIGNKLLLHMAAAYRMIDGESQELVPEIKTLDQRRVLYEQLKGTFERKELIKEAKLQGVSERTAERWNDKWQKEGIVIKMEHGKYKKVG